MCVRYWIDPRFMMAMGRQWLAAKLTRAPVQMLPPSMADALRSQGARDERDRIKGVYFASSHVQLDPLIERLMFDGKTPPEGAAMAMVAVMQAEIAIRDEAVKRGHEGPSFRRH